GSSRNLRGRRRCDLTPFWKPRSTVSLPRCHPALRVARLERRPRRKRLRRTRRIDDVQTAEEAPMAVTYYVALPFIRTEDGVAPGEAQECQSEGTAIRRAEGMSRDPANAGAVRIQARR